MQAHFGQLEILLSDEFFLILSYPIPFPDPSPPPPPQKH